MEKLLEPNRDQIEIFVDAMFRHAGREGYVSVRSFLTNSKTFRISTANLSGGLRHLIDVAEDDARRAANNPVATVFCPPIAVFNGANGRAREADLLKGLVLSVECDQYPDQARNRLEELLGPATMVVRSGGQWVDPDDGLPQDKLHLHWRLALPASGDTLDNLKQARKLATAIVGGDHSNIPIVHSLRWPGSWHRKAKPRLCEIVSCNADAEIDLNEVLAALKDAAPDVLTQGNGAAKCTSPADWGELTNNIIAGRDLHLSVARLAAKFVRSGMANGAAVNQLRGMMEHSAARQQRPQEWQDRYDDIPRAVDTAIQKFSEAEPAPVKSDLIVNESDPTATAIELAALIAAQEDFLFNGHAPVRIATEADNLPRAVEVTNEAVRVYAHRLCRPVKIIKKKIVPVPLSKDIAQLYLNGLEGAWGLRNFRGVTTSPILKNDGSIRYAEGYDRETGLWCHNIPNLKIPEQPTTTDALEALHILRQFFQTFPFADGGRMMEDGVETTDFTQPIGLDESAFLMALLTAVCRQSLELAPAYLVRAPKFSGAGTGKGLAVKALCIIGSGVRPSAFTSGHDKEEFDKRLSAALIEARPAVFLDNFNAKELRSDILNSAITENPAHIRIMGQSKNVPLNTRCFIGITGNAVEIAEDMVRRIICTSLDAHMENPEQRKFAPGFLDSVLANREMLLSAALTIWRWGRHNTLERGRPIGSFEVWAEWCRDPLLALGAKDPIERLDEIKAADPRRRAIVAVFDAWWDKHKDSTIKAKDLDQEVIELIDTRAIWKKDGNLQYNRQRIAGFLAAHTNTRVGGYLLEQTKDETLARPPALYTLRHSAD
jgi:hypothetical protein